MKMVPKSKKNYNRPKLINHGKIRKITGGHPGSATEGMSGMSMP